MTIKPTYFSPVSGFIRQIAHSVPFPFLRRKSKAAAHHPQIAWSAFSRPDESELLAMEEEISPLVEAEIYVIYGRIRDAEMALEAGVKSGRITARESAQFWSGQGRLEG